MGTADDTSVDATVTHADKAGVAVCYSDVFTLAQVCLDSLDLAGLNLATVIECLSLLVPKVNMNGVSRLPCMCLWLHTIVILVHRL